MSSSVVWLLMRICLCLFAFYSTQLTQVKAIRDGVEYGERTLAVVASEVEQFDPVIGRIWVYLDQLLKKC